MIDITATPDIGSLIQIFIFLLITICVLFIPIYFLIKLSKKMSNIESKINSIEDMLKKRN